jgi:hypothetical protein
MCNPNMFRPKHLRIPLQRMWEVAVLYEDYNPSGDSNRSSSLQDWEPHHYGSALSITSRESFHESFEDFIH